MSEAAFTPKPPPRGLDRGPPEPDEVVVMPMQFVAAIRKVGTLLREVKSKWALSGDAGEVMNNVALEPDRLEIVTTREGCDEISQKLSTYQTIAPAESEKKLERAAIVDGTNYPVYVRSRYAEFMVNGSKLEVYGDMQFKVGDWDWGDPLDWEAVDVYLVGEKIPTLPISMKSELYMGLGWLDRVLLIGDAIRRGTHAQV